MNNSDITEIILNQYQRAFKMFREAVMAFPAEEWRKGEFDYFRPAGVAYHVVESIDCLCGDQPVDKFVWGGRFGVDWEDKNSDRLPDQVQLLTYLDEIYDKMLAWFRKTDLLEVETLFPWTGSLILGRAIYNLRNIQHHVSELSLELTRRGYKRPEWR